MRYRNKLPQNNGMKKQGKLGHSCFRERRGTHFIVLNMILCFAFLLAGSLLLDTPVYAGGLADSVGRSSGGGLADKVGGDEHSGLVDIVESLPDAEIEPTRADVSPVGVPEDDVPAAVEPETESSATFAEWSTDEPLVVDMADLWTTSEEGDLAERANELSREYGIVLVIVSTSSTEGKSTVAYADDFFDYHPYGEDGILVLFDMENKEVYISTTGKGIELLNDARIESILDEIFANDNIADGHYYSAAVGFLDASEVYLKAGPAKPGHDGVKRVRHMTLGNVLMALLFAGIASMLFYRSNAHQYQKRKQQPFFDTTNAVTEYSFINDQFLTKSVTSVVRSSSSSSGGRGSTSTHSGSSGRSHGGGGRKF
ncbi:MAG TPA: TPM domain-containing protein [Clostridiaceae bacterium]|nr:TPM domain-containing protein [Clostridiaceae bacterium]